MRIRLSMIVVLLCTIQVSLFAQEKTVKLLTVGNSFAENALKHLPRIVEAAGDKLIFAKANLGGHSLQQHWGYVEKFEADNQDPAGSPYVKKTMSLQQLLVKDQWDYVTIQQLSIKSHNPDTYHPYAENLYNYIHKYAPQAKILAQQIWAYRVDDPRFLPTNKEEGGPKSHQEMYQMVRDANHALAKQLNIGLLPSGDAMYLADTDPKWGFKPDATFDKSTAVQPQLPDQSHSLHVGWAWRKQKDGSTKLSYDGHHANYTGEYLIGCVWYEVLFGKSVVDNSYVPENMDPEYAAFLRQTAHKAVENLKAEK